MAKRNEVDFFKLSVEEQAREIERQTKKLIARLPDLKKNLKMYGEVSDELYNLTEDEMSTIGTTYAKAVRGGEISTPSSKRAYQKFINDMRKYTRRSIRDIAVETAGKRMDDWLETIKNNGSQAEYDYAKELVDKMSDSDKIGFTRSQFFLDVGDWGSDQFQEYLKNNNYSIMTHKLELYLNNKGYDTKNDYDDGVKGIKHKATRKGQRIKKG